MTGEKFVRLFGEIDEKLLVREERAYNGSKRRTHLVKWGAVAASICLLICVSAVLIPKPYDDFAMDADIPEWFLSYANESIEIDSLDKLNYYAAKRAVENDAIDVKTELKYGVRRLSAKNDDKTYFELDVNEVFTVNKVIAFQIKLSNPSNINGFLEAKLGAGTVDVIITENSLENMITFKNGDRYFSCLYNGYEKNEIDNRIIVRHHFSTHKYIEGFSIVKNVSQENYGFYIWVDERTGKVERFECEFSIGAAPSYDYFPDTASVVSDSGFTSKLKGSFTVEELERYFNNR